MKEVRFKIPLTEVVWFQEGPGVRNTQYTQSGVKLLNVANLVDGKIDLSTSDRYISEEEAYGKYKHFLADDGDLIIASSGIKVEYIDKKIGFIHKEHLPLCMNTSTIRFKVIDEQEFSIKYFMYFLKSREFKRQLFIHITGCAQLNFGPSHLKKMYISYPPLPEQSRIVEELDLLSNIIEKKRQQLSELDNLAQSIFYDMFGNPVKNEKGWEVKKLTDVCHIQYGYAFDSSCFCDDESYPQLVRIRDIIRGFSETFYKGDIPEGYYVYKGDYLIGMDGEFNIAPWQTEKALLNQRVCKISSIGNIVDCFVYYYMRNILKEIEKETSFVTVKHLSAKRLNSIFIPLPPLSLQQLFAQKIEAIEKEKELIKQSIKATEELFNSRMDYYFS